MIVNCKSLNDAPFASPPGIYDETNFALPAEKTAQRRGELKPCEGNSAIGIAFRGCLAPVLSNQGVGILKKRSSRTGPMSFRAVRN